MVHINQRFPMVVNIRFVRALFFVSPAFQGWEFSGGASLVFAAVAASS
jgi:hypothetical protein